ncbi:MAGE-domain-containing protein [Mollisia scopiformis]|uniref:MAGE-domain-containing protein n=1 Tax=Mollisia scopiformis TaxID=149040 RepID=A0A194XTI0_MOLSC|nr:MAGE-domain-containing protein [Mollisia scopiformis]KUJ23625.1 MAGE-domain-containing protein [Mollisia scopiformis]
MPSAARRRRTVQEEEESSEEEEDRRQSTQRNRRHAPPSDDEEEEEEEEGAGDDEMDVDARPDAQDQTVKKMVRYALACEYQRMPIRRAGISEKVIGKQRGSFRRVFEAAQTQLRTKFGMEMVELPTKEKTTLKDKRAAQKTKGGAKTTSSYVLTTILPPEYRTADIMPPSIVGDIEDEAQYLGICSLIVSIIALSPNATLADVQLKKHLGRMNMERNAGGLGRTEDVLKKMCNQGYVQKVVEKNQDEETIDWKVGPRGKVEMASTGIRGLVLEVYGENAPEDLDKRLQRSLGMEIKKASTGNGVNGQETAEAEEADEERDNGDPGPSSRRTSGRRRG